MLPPEIEARVASIATDFESGASELTLKALEVFEALLVTDPPSSALEELAAKLTSAQPNMASVRNVSQLSARVIAGSSNAPMALREIRRELMGAQEKIARTALDAIPGRPTVVTLSRSSAVSAVLKILHSRRRLAAVHVLESRPGLEGRRAVVELVAGGIPAKLAEDDLGMSLVRRSDLVLTGADTVLLDGTLVNKVGTHELALVAEAAGKPFHSACETIKIDSLHTAQTFQPATSDPENVLAGVLFDLTPPQFVTSYITDKGVFEPKSIARVWLL